MQNYIIQEKLKKIRLSLPFFTGPSTILGIQFFAFHRLVAVIACYVFTMVKSMNNVCMNIHTNKKKYHQYL